MSEYSGIRKIPVVFRLYEKTGSKTDRLVEVVGNMSTLSGVKDSVNLQSIESNPADPTGNILVYSVMFNPEDETAMVNNLKFVKSIFEKLFNNYPSYVEPTQAHLFERSDDNSNN